MRRSPMRRAIPALAAIVASALALVGCTAASPSAPGGVVRVGMTEPTVAVAPAHFRDPLVARVLPSVTAGLTTVLPDGTVALELAESIATDDNVHFDVTLHPEAAFSDGTPVTAASFVDAWREAALIDSDDARRGAFSTFVGYEPQPAADAEAAPDAPTGDLVEAGGLEVIDKRRFRITLTNPRPEFPVELSRAEYLPEHPESLDDGDVVAPGAGPYRVVSARAGDRWELEPNPGYVGPREPANAGISLRWFSSVTTALSELLAGQLDVVDQLPASGRDEWEELLDGRVLSQPLPALYSLVLPGELARLRGEEGKLRVQALALAIDRTEIAEQVLAGGVAATDFLPVPVPTTDIPVTWLDRANDINAERRWFEANDISFWEPVFTIAVVDDSVEELIAERLAARFLTALGVEAVVVRFESAEELEAGVASDELIVFRIRRSEALSPAVADSLRRSLGGTLPTEVRDALSEASRVADPAESARLAAEAQRLLLDDPPILPLASPSISAAYGTDVVGVRFDWRGVLDLAGIDAER